MGKVNNTCLLGSILTMLKESTSFPSHTADASTQAIAGKILRLRVLFFDWC